MCLRPHQNSSRWWLQNTAETKAEYWKGWFHGIIEREDFFGVEIRSRRLMGDYPEMIERLLTELRVKEYIHPRDNSDLDYIDRDKLVSIDSREELNSFFGLNFNYSAAGILDVFDGIVSRSPQTWLLRQSERASGGDMVRRQQYDELHTRAQELYTTLSKLEVQDQAMMGEISDDRTMTAQVRAHLNEKDVFDQNVSVLTPISRRDFFKVTLAAAAGVMLIGSNQRALAAEPDDPHVKQKAKNLLGSYLDDVLNNKLPIYVGNVKPSWVEIFTINRDDHLAVKEAKRKYQDLLRDDNLLLAFVNEIFEVFKEAQRKTANPYINATLNIELARKVLDNAMMVEEIGASIESIDKAPLSDPGGIDFSAVGGSASGGNPNNILQTQGQGINIPPFDPAQFEGVTIEGFTPVIFSITPITNLPLILGAAEDSNLQEKI